MHPDFFCVEASLQSLPCIASGDTRIISVIASRRNGWHSNGRPAPAAIPVIPPGTRPIGSHQASLGRSAVPGAAILAACVLPEQGLPGNPRTPSRRQVAPQHPEPSNRPLSAQRRRLKTHHFPSKPSPFGISCIPAPKPRSAFCAEHETAMSTVTSTLAVFLT